MIGTVLRLADLPAHVDPRHASATSRRAAPDRASPASNRSSASSAVGGDLDAEPLPVRPICSGLDEARLVLDDQDGWLLTRLRPLRQSDRSSAHSAVSTRRVLDRVAWAVGRRRQPQDERAPLTLDRRHDHGRRGCWRRDGRSTGRARSRRSRDCGPGRPGRSVRRPGRGRVAECRRPGRRRRSRSTSASCRDADLRPTSARLAVLDGVLDAGCRRRDELPAVADDQRCPGRPRVRLGSSVDDPISRWRAISVTRSTASPITSASRTGSGSRSAPDLDPRQLHQIVDRGRRPIGFRHDPGGRSGAIVSDRSRRPASRRARTAHRRGLQLVGDVGDEVGPDRDRRGAARRCRRRTTTTPPSGIERAATTNTALGGPYSSSISLADGRHDAAETRCGVRWRSSTSTPTWVPLMRSGCRVAEHGSSRRASATTTPVGCCVEHIAERRRRRLGHAERID